MVVAERRAQLIRVDRQIRTGAEPRLDLTFQAALLKLVDESLQVAEVALRQGRRNRARYAGSFDLPERTLQTVDNTHRTILLFVPHSMHDIQLDFHETWFGPSQGFCGRR